MRHWLLVMTLLAIQTAYSSVSDIGSVINSQIKTKMGENPINHVPNYQEPLPQEDSSSMETRGLEKSRDSEAVKSVNELSKKDFTISEGTLQKFKDVSEKNKEELNQELTDLVKEYDDCDIGSGSRAEYKYCDSVREEGCNKNHKYSCHSIKEQNLFQSCHKKLDLTCSGYNEGMPTVTYNNFPGWSYQYPYLYIGEKTHNLTHKCGSPVFYSGGWYWRFEFEIEDLSLLKAFVLRDLWVDDEVFIRINGTEVYAFPNWRGGCEYYALFQPKPNFDFKPYIKKGKNIFEVRLIVGGLGLLWQKLEIRYDKCAYFNEIIDKVDCDAIEQNTQNICTRASSQCLNSSEKKISGTKVARCWDEKIDYSCKSRESTDYCEPLRNNQDCYQLSTNCLAKQEGECVNSVNEFSCSRTIPESTKIFFKGEATENCPELKSECSILENNCNYISKKCLLRDNFGNCNHYENRYECSSGSGMRCADEEYCVGDGCKEITYEKDKDFAKAATHLAILDEIDEGYDEGKINIFGGLAKSCSRDPFGYSNCCKSSGWGEDLGLASCSTEEQDLALAQKKGRCVYLGGYCSKKKLGICKKKTQTSCCFENKLSKILQEQGRVQLGIGWGSAKYPNCRALTPEELTKLDFGKMDFSELFGEVSTNVPDNGLTEEQLKNKIDEFYQRVSHPRVQR